MSTYLPESEPDPFDALPVETEIYILPSGEVVIADLPAELAELLTTLHPAPQMSSDQEQQP